MLREQVLKSWQNLQAKVSKQQEDLKTHLTFYQSSPFFQLTPATPKEMIKQHKNINFLFLDSAFERKKIIDLNELGVNAKSLQSIWLNYSLIGDDINPQQVLFTSDYGQSSWHLCPQYTPVLKPLFGRKIYFLNHNTIAVESSGQPKQISAHLAEEVREKDYRHTLYLKPEPLEILVDNNHA